MTIDRTTSAFDLSIGTSMALESLLKGPRQPYDILRPIPDVPHELIYYNSFYINVDTLIRNLLSSISDVLVKADPQVMAEVIVSEMDTLNDILNSQAPNTVVVYYINTVMDVKPVFEKLGRLRVPTTDAQKSLFNLTDTIRWIVKKTARSTIQEFSSYPKSQIGGKCLILTHNTVDLLAYPYYRELDLLESHTGKVKTFKDRYTKLYPVPKANMSILPFNYMTYFIFGDKQLVKPENIKLRRGVMDMAEENAWNVTLSTGKIRLQARNHRDPALFHYINDIKKI